MKDKTMNLEYAKNPRWVNAEHTMIDLEIKWETINVELPFTASPTDCEAHGRAIFEQASQGAFGPVAEYVAPPESLTLQDDLQPTTEGAQSL